MSTLHRSAFTRPALLAALDPALLRAFLAPHAAFFAARGVPLDPAPDADALAAVFMEPGPDTPPGLVEALHCIKELSAPATADALIAEAARLGLTLPPAATLPEIAMRLWLADPAAVITLHAKHSMLRVRSFEYYSSVGDDPEPPRPAADTLAALARDLDHWLTQKGRGAGARVYAHPRRGEIWFLVRRGDLPRREIAIEAGTRRAMAFRPEKTDVVVYNQLTNELGVNAPSHALRDLYRTLFGYHFFGCYGQFGGAAKYSLEPLRDHGPRSLQTVDVPGIEHIRLGELQYTVSGIVPALHTVKADDVFACLTGGPGGIHPGWALKKATFRIRFTGQPRARSLTLKPPNVALYTRDSDATVAEQWLLRRAFIQPPRHYDARQPEFRFAVP